MRLSVEVGEAKYGGDGVGSIDPEGNVDVEYTLICANNTISGQVRSDQIRSDQIRSGQVRSGQVRSDQMESYQQQRWRVPKSLSETRQD